MREFAVGIEDHYAWANLVSVALRGPELEILDKRRVALLDTHLPASPYHHDTLEMPLPDAERLVRDVRASASGRAQVALESLLRELAPAACRAIAIRVPPLPALPPGVAEVHDNPWVMYRADGMIYHQALTGAAARLNLRVSNFDKARVVGRAAELLGLTSGDLEGRLKAFGKRLGPPWRKGQMLACAAAVVALAES